MSQTDPSSDPQYSGEPLHAAKAHLMEPQSVQPAYDDGHYRDLDLDEISIWQQNHGNFLMAFVAGVFVLGSGILACRQFRGTAEPLNLQSPYAGEAWPEGQQDGDDEASDPKTSADQIAPPQSERGSAAEHSPNRQASAPRSPRPSSAKIIAIGATSDQGTVKFAIYDSAESFNQTDRALVRANAEPADGRATIQKAVGNLPKQFAIAVFHDANDDGVLNRNSFGIPTEAYGFSNNARGLTGPPSYAQSLVKRPAAGDIIKISIR